MTSYKELECPECDNPTLRQKRVRVFPQVSMPSPEGCTVVEQDSGSTLVVRADDLEFPRPGADTAPAVTIIHDCETCGATDMHLHLVQRAGYSCLFWDISGTLSRDVGHGRPPTESERRLIDQLRAEVDRTWVRYMNPQRHGFPVTDARDLLSSYQRAVHNLQSTVTSMRRDGVNI